MNTASRITKLNEVCDGTLDIVHHNQWEIHSYGDNTPLSMKVKYPFISDPDIKVAVKKAYDFVFEEVGATEQEEVQEREEAENQDMMDRQEESDLDSFISNYGGNE